MKIGIVVPHIFMQDTVLPHVIFSPGVLAIDLAESLQRLGHDVTLFTPGPITTAVNNETADLSLFQKELDARGDTFMELLKKHPFTFITLARQTQSELIAKAYKLANDNKLDIVHIYTNEEDIALPFAQFSNKPVVFTHHDPFNFFIRYKSVFPKYPKFNWISFSYAQRQSMPKNTNWVSNIYHGLPKDKYAPEYEEPEDYIVYLGRIVKPKGVHLAIAAVQEYNKTTDRKLKLKIAGKHYAGHKKDKYWQEEILPLLDDPNIEFVGFMKSVDNKQALLSKAKALIIPSIYEEPFGMVMIEALACATPVIGFDSGSIPEIINSKTGIIVKKAGTEQARSKRLAQAIQKINKINRTDCRKEFEARFTSERMAKDYLKVYKKLIKV